VRIDITRIVQRGEDRSSIQFESPLGSARAEWVGRPPATPAAYDVELEIDQSLAWGEDVYPLPHRQDRIAMVGNEVLIQGLLERVDNGCAVVRIGDSVLMVEPTGPSLTPGTPIGIRTNRLLLYDMNL
jgi:hypothetical protein